MSDVGLSESSTQECIIEGLAKASQELQHFSWNYDLEEATTLLSTLSNSSHFTSLQSIHLLGPVKSKTRRTSYRSKFAQNGVKICLSE